MSSSAPSVRYSTNNVGEAKEFSWEYPVPVNKFWGDLEFIDGRNFLQCFTSGEIEQLPLDDSRDITGKLELLLQLLQDKLSAEDTLASPQTLYDVDFEAWDKLLLGIHTMQKRLGTWDFLLHGGQ
jgi:hypothetical protein